MSICSKTGFHGVLASLSGRYPPLEGRSPTCYSPVRHSTQGRSPFRVRLACVRHAASVDSEPGSNSHVKCAVSAVSDRSNCLTRSPVDLALALFLSYLCWWMVVNHPLTLDGRPPSRTPSFESGRSGGQVHFHCLATAFVNIPANIV